jgi:hypothetical protein
MKKFRKYSLWLGGCLIEKILKIDFGFFKEQFNH